MNSFGGYIVENTVDESYLQFSRGLDIFDSQYPYGVALAETFERNFTDGIKINIRLDG